MNHDLLSEVRASLRNELEARDYSVAKDTVVRNGELYIWGEGDRAAALFEFKETADEACATMYQGRWLPTLPPRFAVLPEAERHSPAVDFMRQAGLSVLFHDSSGDQVAFLDLDEVLAEVDRRRARPV